MNPDPFCTDFSPGATELMDFISHSVPFILDKFFMTVVPLYGIFTTILFCHRLENNRRSFCFPFLSSSSGRNQICQSWISSLVFSVCWLLSFLRRCVVWASGRNQICQSWISSLVFSACWLLSFLRRCAVWAPVPVGLLTNVLGTNGFTIPPFMNGLIPKPKGLAPKPN